MQPNLLYPNRLSANYPLTLVLILARTNSEDGISMQMQEPVLPSSTVDVLAIKIDSRLLKSVWASVNLPDQTLSHQVLLARIHMVLHLTSTSLHLISQLLLLLQKLLQEKMRLLMIQKLALPLKRDVIKQRQDVSLELLGTMMTELSVKNVTVTSHAMVSNVLLEQLVKLSLTMPEERLCTKLSARMIPKMASVLKSKVWTTVMKNAKLMVIVLEHRNVVTMVVESLVCKLLMILERLIMMMMA